MEVTSADPLASSNTLLQMHTRVKKYSIQKQKATKKYQGTYADALIIESFFMVNLGSGPLTRALLPAFPALLVLELLASADFCG